MSNTLTLEVLKDAVSSKAAAFRCRRRLQPAGGEGDKVFPPTYAKTVYVVEKRKIVGREQPVTCVLMDSVQSQANRMELALQEALDAGKIKIPVLIVDFSEYAPTDDKDAQNNDLRLFDDVGKISSLQAPHRIADAILRDSEWDGKPFRISEKGRVLNAASNANATPLFRFCPTALLFGMWDSTGPKGGLGPKFERALVSEIVGIGVEYDDSYRALGIRRDPLEIRAAVNVLKEADNSWSVVDAKNKKTVSPSKINHGNILLDSKNSGVTIEYAEQLTTLSLICLRRLRFPIDKNDPKEVDVAAQTTLAALGLCAATLAFESGMDLRSRCLLWPEGIMEWELLKAPGQTPEKYSLNGDEAIALLEQAVQEAKGLGIPWEEEAITLKPSKNLLKLVRASQLMAIDDPADKEE